ncbi:hypothetical protein [Microbulbifer aggregans]|uniref:hypothetical protein n=1 Tax=Microbulbifer aggregans TaxID=1769779 RepID=UPI001CFEC1FA|nr:hypothetical protein [Microbulbifer aggregans]
MAKTIWFILPLLLLTLVAALAGPRNEQRSERVLFSDAESSGGVRATQVKSSIRGYQTMEYLIEAKTGQSLDLNLHSNNRASGFRVTAPAAPRPMHSARGQSARFKGTLPRDGTYRVEIFLKDTAAENGERAAFSLNIRLSNPGGP